MVGYVNKYGEGSNEPLIEKWDGQSWTLATLPPLSSYSVSLNGIACASAADCWAVGSYLDPNASVPQTLIEHWDGSSWSIINSPNTNSTETNGLDAITCTSGSDCWAVGYSQNGALAQHWNGTSWSIVSLPKPANSYNYALNDVTCVSASNCWAAGNYFDPNYPGTDKTLLQHFDGKSWSIVSSPNADESQFPHSYLNGITCASAADCWAVGHSENTSVGTYAALVEHWNGTAWSIVSSAVTSSAALPRHVSCAASSDCWIVGYAGGQTLTEHWDGNSWSLVGSPDADTTTWNAFYGVTCLSGSNCWAAGLYSDSHLSVYQSLAANWDGVSWNRVPSANPITEVHTVTENELQGVDCVSSIDCWAVGFVRDVNYSTLTQHWDGNSWTIVASPNSQDWYNELKSVTCNSASDCWAVGISQAGAVHGLIEHWDGAAWSIVPSPSADAWLFSVTCSSPTNCWAVGYGNVGGIAGRTFIERWDGTSWTNFPSPSVSSATLNVLSGVACASASHCWAVGYSGTENSAGGFRPDTLMEEWDGNSWSIIAGPYFNSTASLAAATCISATDCWAVGNYWNGVTSQMLFEHFDGTTWSVVLGTSKSSAYQAPQNINCPSSNECWLVGYQNNNNGPYRPLIANWDGVSWAEVPDPNPSPSEAHLLNSVNCSSLSQCWAVGYDSSIESTPQTLTELYTPPNVPTYTISVNPSPLNAGTVDGGGRYTSGFQTTVTASPLSGYNFHNWIENGVIVSTSPAYSFTVEFDRSLFANFVQLAATPAILPAGGTFKKKVNVTIACATSGATIYYTTDGSDPTTSSSVYGTSTGKKKFKGINITGKGPHTVKAIAVAPGYDPSLPAVVNFFVN